MAGRIPSSPITAFAAIDQSVIGTLAVVAAVSGKRICVMNYTVVLSAAGTYQFASSATARTGAMEAPDSGGASADSSNKDFPLFVTEVGEALNIITTGTGALAKGHLTYYLSD